ncbi:MAG TPA: hypothetical protein VMC09_13770 [Anaerolineales bacterium]|nr:hypothetical protein [Anaerolineales bacterium]
MKPRTLLLAFVAAVLAACAGPAPHPSTPTAPPCRRAPWSSPTRPVG